MRQLANYLELLWRKGSEAAELRAQGVGSNPDINLVPRPGGCVRINGGPCLTVGMPYVRTLIPSARLNTLFSNPVEILPAPGTGSFVTYKSITGRYTAGNIGYPSSATRPGTPGTAMPDSSATGQTYFLGYGNPILGNLDNGAFLFLGVSQFTVSPNVPLGVTGLFYSKTLDTGSGISGLADALLPLSSPYIYDFSFKPGDVDNQPVMLSTGADFLGSNGIDKTGITLNAGGAGYVARDVVSVDGGTAGSLASILIDTVDGGGAVLTFTLLSSGAGYTVSAGNATTPVTGAGAGFTVDIGAVGDGDGTLSLLVEYQILPTNF